MNQYKDSPPLLCRLDHDERVANSEPETVAEKFLDTAISSRAIVITPEKLPKQHDEELLLLSKQPVHPRHLDVLEKLGSGSFGTVYLARISGGGGALFAVKSIKKNLIIKTRSAHNVKRERSLTRELNSPFILKLRTAFQTSNALYLATDYYAGGSLADLLKRKQQDGTGICILAIRFFTIEIVLALEYLRQKGVIHRDIKPSNILLSAHGHIALADFGVATYSGPSFKRSSETSSFKKKNKNFAATPSSTVQMLKNRSKKDTRKKHQDEAWLVASGFHGTPAYTAPELLSGEIYNHSIDWWSLGCTLYELRVGHSPFAAANARNLFRNILHARIPKILPKPLHDLLTTGLLVLNPKQRFSSLSDVQCSCFFYNVDWSLAANRELENPLGPLVLPSFIALDANGNVYYNPKAQDGPTVSTSASFDEEKKEKKSQARKQRRHRPFPSKSKKLSPRVKLFQGFALDPEFNLDAKPEDYTAACAHHLTWA
uniref:Protein kinase domain-containing protein n=1 Tax=Aureoumbra lagunensis TaxID=44058 RepID=A0A7S3K224_9STRA